VAARRGQFVNAAGIVVVPHSLLMPWSSIHARRFSRKGHCWTSQIVAPNADHHRHCHPAGGLFSFVTRSAIMFHFSRSSQIILVLLILGAEGCLAKRDDSTSTVRQIAAIHLHLNLSQVKVESTLGDLGCTRDQFLKLIRAIQDAFSTTLSPKSDHRLSGNDDSWKSIRIIDLADMVRPEWSKRIREKDEGRKGER
jgi:hypothetical protein